MDSVADTSVPGSTHRARASEERRQRVLQAANVCFSRGGFQKTAVDQIAQEAGVSKGLVFVFFGTKEALYQAVVNDTLNEWRRFSEQEAALYADDPAEELRRLFIGSFLFIQRHPMLSALFGRSNRGWMLNSPDVTRVNKAWQERLQQVLRKGVRAGSMRADVDIPRAVEIIHELQWSLVDRQLDSANGGASGFDKRLAEDAIGLLLDGLNRKSPA